MMFPYYDRNLRNQRERWEGSEEKIKRLARGMCLGLKHMHDSGSVHRDIKTDNILLQNDLGDPVIIDFGLVNTRELKNGTPGYLAPEQVAGRKRDPK